MKKVRLLFTGLLVVCVMVICYCGTLVHAVSDSLEYSWFWAPRLCVGQTLEHGDYIQFTHSSPLLYEGRPVDFLKRVACLPGEQLSLKGREFFCNGELLVVAKEKGRDGRVLEMFYPPEKTIPAGRYFVVGDNPDSYDSRYWGYVTDGQVSCKVWPLF